MISLAEEGGCLGPEDVDASLGQVRADFACRWESFWSHSAGGFLSPQISITALTTPHARMERRVPTAAIGATPAPVAQATLVWTVSWSSASVIAIPVEMAAAVR